MKEFVGSDQLIRRSNFGRMHQIDKIEVLKARLGTSHHLLERIRHSSPKSPSGVRISCQSRPEPAHSAAMIMPI